MAGRFACPAAFLSFWEPICRAPLALARGDALAWRATRQWERGLVSFRCASTIVRKSRCTASCSPASRAEGATSAPGSAEGTCGCRARPGKLSACSADCAAAELSAILSCTARSTYYFVARIVGRSVPRLAICRRILDDCCRNNMILQIRNQRRKYGGRERELYLQGCHADLRASNEASS
jgi:hypothetical protein